MGLKMVYKIGKWRHWIKWDQQIDVYMIVEAINWIS